MQRTRPTQPKGEFSLDQHAVRRRENGGKEEGSVLIGWLTVGLSAFALAIILCTDDEAVSLAKGRKEGICHLYKFEASLPVSFPLPSHLNVFIFYYFQPLSIGTRHDELRPAALSTSDARNERFVTSAALRKRTQNSQINLGEGGGGPSPAMRSTYTDNSERAWQKKQPGEKAQSIRPRTSDLWKVCEMGHLATNSFFSTYFHRAKGQSKGQQQHGSNLRRKVGVKGPNHFGQRRMDHFWMEQIGHSKGRQAT